MVVHRAMLRRIYDWCIDAAHKPYALWILGAVAFAESSFFPVPPDVMLLPMSVARPRRAWLFATVCTVASVAGGVLGYAIGALLYDSVGQWLINLYGLGSKVEAFRAVLCPMGSLDHHRQGPDADPVQARDHHFGFCRLQYLVVHCAARSSVAACASSSVAILLNRYGDVIRAELEKRLGLWVSLGAALLVFGFFIAYRLL